MRVDRQHRNTPAPALGRPVEGEEFKRPAHFGVPCHDDSRSCLHRCRCARLLVDARGNCPRSASGSGWARCAGRPVARSGLLVRCPASSARPVGPGACLRLYPGAQSGFIERSRSISPRQVIPLSGRRCTATTPTLSRSIPHCNRPSLELTDSPFGDSLCSRTYSPVSPCFRG